MQRVQNDAIVVKAIGRVEKSTILQPKLVIVN